ncbi:MAG: dihydrodipicolinate synthase family protein [Chloroflexi bacterium]|nr:dihydrodipicolinate synthase family protein [Chloroflexota bacterium]
MSEPYRGVYVIMVTPFDAQGRLDEDSLRHLTEFLIQAGAQGLVPLGIMGEVFKLSDAERLRVAKLVIDQAAGRVPVIVGTAHSGTDVAIWLSREAEATGAAGLLLMPPYVIKPDAEGVVEFYKTVGAAVGIPVFVQDEPATTGIAMPAPLIARIHREVPLARYGKIEAAPTPQKISALRELAGSGLTLFGGLGGLYCLEELERGADGVMTGFAYPEILRRLWDAFSIGQVDAAREVFYRYLPLIKHEFQTGIGIAIRKEVFYLRGVIASPTIRQPSPRLDQRTRDQTRRLIELLELPLGLATAV